jgi:hypothetical protein
VGESGGGESEATRCRTDSETAVKGGAGEGRRAERLSESAKALLASGENGEGFAGPGCACVPLFSISTGARSAAGETTG